MFTGTSFNPLWPFYWVNWVAAGDQWDLNRQQVLELDVENVKSMLSRQTDEMWVDSILLASPPAVNKTERWQLDVLEEVWLPVTAKPGGFCEIFVTDAGTYRSDTIAKDVETFCYLDARAAIGSTPESATAY